jgi:oligopeptide transport system substrate-binding protein
MTTMKHWRGVMVLCVTAMTFALQPVAAQEPAKAPLKVLRTSQRTAETGFDPQKISDVYSNDICGEIFDTALDYDYLARPSKLMPNLLTQMPTVAQSGLSYTFHFKQGIYFTDDPAFKGRRRELIAADMAYSLRRLLDPSIASPNSWLIEGKIAGLDEVAAKGKKTGQYDYATAVSGLQILDRYTLRIALNRPDFNFLYIFAMPATAPLAREVMEYYKDDTMGHPVGTGPFKLGQWIRRSNIVLERNPTFRDEYLDTSHADMNDEWDKEVVSSIAGKKLPLLDRIEIYPIESEQPYFLAFMNGEHDLTQEIPSTYRSQVYAGGKLAPSLARQGVRAFLELQAELTYDVFNMEDPVVGGYDAQHVALRRAMSMGYNRNQEISVIRQNTPLAAQSLIPPGVVGYDPTFTAAGQDYDPVGAQALLDVYGYKDRDEDGYREQPDGSPLVIEYKNSSGSLASVMLAQLWLKSMNDIGIRMKMTQMQFADLIRDQKVGKYQMTGAAWLADYPDAQNFLQLLYGPNKGASNNARFDLPEFNRLYEQALMMPDSPERTALYREMNRYALAYAPWRLGVTRSWLHLMRPWVKGYKKHPMFHARYKYLDIDVAAQQAARK